MRIAAVAVVIAGIAVAASSALSSSMTRDAHLPLDLSALSRQSRPSRTIFHETAYRSTVEALRRDAPPYYARLEALNANSSPQRYFLELSVIRSAIRENDELAASAPDVTLLNIAGYQRAFLLALQRRGKAECANYLAHPGDFFDVGAQEDLDPFSSAAYGDLQAAELDAIKAGAEEPVSHADLGGDDRTAFMKALGPEMVVRAKFDPTMKQCGTNLAVLNAMFEVPISTAGRFMASEYKQGGMFSIQ